MAHRKKVKNSLTRHHLKNKCMGGMNTPENILMLWKNKHVAWHTLFKNMNLDQIIECLYRVRELQRRKK